MWSSPVFQVPQWLKRTLVFIRADQIWVRTRLAIISPSPRTLYPNQAEGVLSRNSATKARNM